MSDIKRSSFLFYESFYEAIKEVPEANQLEALKAIIDYGLYRDIPKLSGISKVIFMMAKPNMDANYIKYLNGKQPKNKDETQDLR